VRPLSFLLQIKNKRLHHIQTEISVWHLKFIYVVLIHHHSFAILTPLEHMSLVKIYIIDNLARGSNVCDSGIS
jgi:hypothetical protein